ncbi:hypothetical protein [Xenorhabdus bharatensis]|uniref:hypothetical protein n=1 Tax=Xenorhabdus bharatensis TaxID=3136256 RepID=UPI0030F37E88
MPFHPPFKTNFEKGDFIFGLNKERSNYAKKYSEFSLVCDPDNISTIDQYSINEKECELRKETGRKIPENQESFYKAIDNHCKYKSIRFRDKFKYSCNKNIFYYTKQVTSRKCKAGLSWVSGSLTGSCIHFVLDEINMEEVVYKHYENNIKRGSSYTGKELRWIYRNRRDPKVISCIQFWRKGKPVKPPWEEGEDAFLWQNYHPKFENSGIEIGEFAEILDMLER